MAGAVSRLDEYPIGASVTLEQLEGDPHPVHARLRAQEPVSWLPALDGWLVTSRQLAIAVMRDAEVFTVDDPRFSTAQVIGPSMLSLDGPEHRRHREPFIDPFRHAEVRRRFAAWTNERARSLVAELAPGGNAELRNDLAAPLAVDVVVEALGLVGVNAKEALGWYEAIVEAVDEVTAGNPVTSEGAAAFGELQSAVEASIAANPDSLLTLVNRTGNLTTQEVVSNAAVLLFGGIVTSESATANAFYQLLSHPDQLEAVRADRKLVINAVEESLRLEPSAAVVDRYATREATVGTAVINESELVTVSLAGANRDPDFFPDPDRFDVRRENAHQNLAFARGPHTCLGIHLARLETKAAVDVVLDMLPSIHLDPARSRPPHGLIFRAPQAVWATWDPPAG